MKQMRDLREMSEKREARTSFKCEKETGKRNKDCERKEKNGC